MINSCTFSKIKKKLKLFILDKRNLNDSEANFVAQTIGNSHLVITDMARPRLKDYEFSWANIVSKDDSAFMCHYAHARIYRYILINCLSLLNFIDKLGLHLSLIAKCKEELQIEPSLEDVKFELLNKPIEMILIQHLARLNIIC